MKMAGIHTVPLNIGDFISGTMHMDTLERGAFIMLLLAHYQIGEDGLPDDAKQLSRIAGVTPKVWDRISPVLADKFTISCGFWKHEKCVDTLRNVHEKSSKQRAKALKKHGLSDATAEPRHSHTKTKTNTNILSKDNTPLTPQKGVERPDDVSVQVWDDFLVTRKSHKAPLTKTALQGIIRESAKAGLSLEAVLQIICSNGWRGFRADWVADKNKKQTPVRQSDQSDMEKQKQIMGIT